MLIRLGPAVLVLAVTVFALIDALLSPPEQVRNLPKWAWLVLILLFDVLGSIAWFVAGRPTAATAGGRSAAWPSGPASRLPERQRARRAPAGPDDDPEFLRRLADSNREHEQLLKKWEADLRERERRLREERGDEPPGEAPTR